MFEVICINLNKDTEEMLCELQSFSSTNYGRVEDPPPPPLDISGAVSRCLILFRNSIQR